MPLPGIFESDVNGKLGKGERDGRGFFFSVFHLAKAAVPLAKESPGRGTGAVERRSLLLDLRSGRRGPRPRSLLRERLFRALLGLLLLSELFSPGMGPESRLSIPGEKHLTA